MQNQLSEYTVRTAQKPIRGDLHQFMQTHPEVLVEEKFNGTRVFVWRGGGVEGDRNLLVTKHNGIYTDEQYPQLFRELSLEKDTMLDAEFIKKTQHLYVFDVLFIAGQDNRHKPLWSRKITLEGVLPLEHDHVHLVQAKFCNTEAAVLGYYNDLIGDGAEGVVVKDVRAAYGTPGTWLKVRNADTIDAPVVSLEETEDTKRTGRVWTYTIGLYEGGKLAWTGRVSSATADVDRAKIEVGTVLEVRFNRFNGEIQFPGTILRIRSDKIPGECTTDQL